jgi:hypothetical protein
MERVDGLDSPKITRNRDGAVVLYDNPWQTWQPKTFWDALVWLTTSKCEPMPSAEEISRIYPLVTPDWNAIHNPPSNAIAATWIGHSTFLIQVFH